MLVAVNRGDTTAETPITLPQSWVDGVVYDGANDSEIEFEGAEARVEVAPKSVRVLAAR